MATQNTTLLGLALPVEGELDGTWGDVVNDSITSLLDSAVAGTTTLSADSDVTLTTTNLAANQARQAVILWTASNGATTRNITAPARSKAYIVINAGTGSIVLRGAGPTTGVTIVSGERCVAAWNGSDFVKIATSTADGVTSVGGTGTVNGITLSGTVTSTGNLTLGGALTGVNLATQVTGTLPVANGGTGITSFGSGVATFLGTPSSANLAAAVTDETGSGALVFAGSPSLTGTPTAPTASTGTNTTQLATTAFVQNQIGAIAAGVSSFSTGTTGLTPSAATTGAVTLAGTLATANGGTGNVNGTVAKLATTNFSIEESGGNLVFKYGATTIGSMSSTGVFTTLSDITGNGTP
jgi:hypothetical protein